MQLGERALLGDGDGVLRVSQRAVPSFFLRIELFELLRIDGRQHEVFRLVLEGFFSTFQVFLSLRDVLERLQVGVGVRADLTALHANHLVKLGAQLFKFSDVDVAR